MRGLAPFIFYTDCQYLHNLILLLPALELFFCTFADHFYFHQMRIVDTRGQLCPAPLIAARKALKEIPAGVSFIVLTDNNVSFNNLSRYFKDNNIDFEVNEAGGVWTLTIKGKTGDFTQASVEEYCKPQVVHFEKGDYIVVISSDKMGDGDKELGNFLICNFIKAVKDLERLPKTMVFYNLGVTLVTNDSPVAEDLRDLEKMGVELLLCATCVAHYKIEAKIGAGIMSNMYTIAEVMASAGNIVKP
jgi:selenium metabolism protein YedF